MPARHGARHEGQHDKTAQHGRRNGIHDLLAVLHTAIRAKHVEVILRHSDQGKVRADHEARAHKGVSDGVPKKALVLADSAAPLGEQSPDKVGNCDRPTSSDEEHDDTAQEPGDKHSPRLGDANPKISPNYTSQNARHSRSDKESDHRH